MGAIIRQQYVDPNTGRREIREMNIDIEIVRPDDYSDASSQLFLKVEPAGHQHNDRSFGRVYLNPEELINVALDGKRTAKLAGCKRSYLVSPCQENSTSISVHDNGPEGLNAVPGDVIAMISDLNGTKQCNALVDSVKGNVVSIIRRASESFFIGAFVENLSNRWHRATPMGAKSQLKQPEPMVFSVLEATTEGIQLFVSYPMTPGVLKGYDIYVRNSVFSEIAPHWIPDAQDLAIDEGEVVVKTYNGGPNAGGGDLCSGKYYVGVVTKDGLGRSNVNESSACIQPVLLD